MTDLIVKYDYQEYSYVRFCGHKTEQSYYLCIVISDRYMITSKLIEEKLKRIEMERVFTLSDLEITADNYERARMKLSRLVKEGKLKKVGKGRFYKPRQSLFGELLPNMEELVSDYLVKNGVQVGYLTGYAIWHRMGLTTQVPNIIEIGCNKKRNKITRAQYTVRFIVQSNKIARDNTHYLQLLDALKYIKHIPDTTPMQSFERIRQIIQTFDAVQIRKLTILAKPYSPATRALLGVMLETLGYEKKSQELKSTLNPATTYKIGLASSSINFKDWYIE